MAVTALHDGYVGEVLDTRDNFGPNQIVYIHWEEHLMFCSALCFPFPPEMPFGAITGEVLPQFYGPHPDFASVDWDTVIWELDGEPFSPDPARSLAEQGVGHKSLLRFWTPGLNGLAESGA